MDADGSKDQGCPAECPRNVPAARSVVAEQALCELFAILVGRLFGAGHAEDKSSDQAARKRDYNFGDRRPFLPSTFSFSLRVLRSMRRISAALPL